MAGGLGVGGEVVGDGDDVCVSAGAEACGEGVGVEDDAVAGLGGADEGGVGECFDVLGVVGGALVELYVEFDCSVPGVPVSCHGSCSPSHHGVDVSRGG